MSRPDPVIVGGACPYCETSSSVEVFEPRDHSQLIECWSCGGEFVVRLRVSIESTALEVAGERHGMLTRKRRLGAIADDLSGKPKRGSHADI